MDGFPVRRFLTLAVALVALVGTRFPHPSSVWGPVSLGMAATLSLMAALSLSDRRHRLAIRLLFVTSLAFLLVPPSPDAALAAVPAPAAALAVLVFLYSLQDDESLQAPRLETQGSRGLVHVLRFLPLITLLGTMLVGVWALRTLLPERIGSAYELRAATEPVLPVLALIGTVVGLLLIRDALRRPVQAPKVPTTDAAGSEGPA